MSVKAVGIVGLPTLNEAGTIASVTATVDQGLAAAFPRGESVIVVADNGSRDGTTAKFLECDTRARQLLVESPPVGTGKGTNVFRIFDMALELSAERLVMLDADTRTMEPGWVERLAAAVDRAEPCMAVPVYRRNRFEGNTTNHLAAPLLAAVMGAYVEQPIAGDFAFNRAFVERARGWLRPPSAALYGIDIHLTANALREGFHVVEVPLGRKLHNPGFPKILFMSQQVLDSLFHAFALLGQPRSFVPRPLAARGSVDEAAERPDPRLVRATMAKVAAYVSEQWPDLCRVFPSVRCLESGQWGPRISVVTWPEVLADAMDGLAAGEHELVRDHLVALYLLRVMTYWDEIDGLAGEAIDELLDRQVAATVEEVQARSIRFEAPAPEGFEPGYWAAVR